MKKRQKSSGIRAAGISVVIKEDGMKLKKGWKKWGAGFLAAALTLGAFAGICGMLIVFYLVFQNAAAALPVTNLLLYLLLWYIPVFIITLQTH